jgi:hypothetical protein
MTLADLMTQGRKARLHALFGGGLRVDDDVDHVHAFDHFAEHGVAVTLVEEGVVGHVDEELAGGRIGSEVRAMDKVPRTLCRPLLASFLIGALVSFCCICG